MKFYINDKYMFNIDNIKDNFYTEYIVNGDLEREKLPLAYRCDWYGMLGFSVVYRFNLPKKVTCNSGIKTRR